MFSKIFLVFATLLVVSGIRQADALPINNIVKIAAMTWPVVIAGLAEYNAKTNPHNDPKKYSQETLRSKIHDGLYKLLPNFSYLKKERDAINYKLGLRFIKLNEVVEGGDQDAVKELVRENKDLIKMVDENGETPLHWAAFRGKKDIVRLLIQHGASVNVIDNFGRSPLYSAIHIGFGHDETARILIEQGAEINQKDRDGDTVLHQAAAIGLKEIVDFLIQNEADVNAQGYHGDTPLHNAALYGHPETVRLLINGGAKANAENKFGHKPEDYVCDNFERCTTEELEIFKILEEAIKKQKLTEKRKQENEITEIVKKVKIL